MKTNHIFRNEDATNFIEALDKIQSGSMQLKRIKQNAIPEALISYGLNRCFEQYFGPALNAEGVEVQYKFRGDDVRLAIDFEIMLYRATIKIFSNIIAHTTPKSIAIDLSLNQFNICLSIKYYCFENENSFEETINRIELHEVEAEISIFTGKIQKTAVDKNTNKIALEFLRPNTSLAHD
jgi:two-component system, NarL family, sensor kinase